METPGGGWHRGVLAGLSDEDRARAIDDHMHALEREDAHVVSTLCALLSDRCTARLPRDADVTPPDPDDLVEALSGLVTQECNNMRRLVDQGGRLTFSKDRPDLFCMVPPVVPGVSYLLDEGDAFVAVMPAAVLSVARGLDWERVRRRVMRHDMLVRFLDTLVDLRGIVREDMAVREYLQAFPDAGLAAGEVSAALLGAVEQEESSACVLVTSDARYFLHYELLWEYRRQRGAEPQVDELVETGELDELLRGLLAQQQCCEPRPASKEMIAEPSLYEWAVRRPGVRAMRVFLDEHVPDGGNDYLFADRATEDLLCEARWGGGVDDTEALSSVLDRHGLVVAGKQADELYELWESLYDATPLWPNNGWSPNELLGM